MLKSAEATLPVPQPAEAPRRDARPDPPLAGDSYIAELIAEVELFVARCERLGGPSLSPFLSASWLRAWYGALGSTAGRRPLLMAVRSLTTGADVLLLPLVSRRVAGLSLVEFADAGIGDYNLPAFDPALQDSAAAARVWRALRHALRGHDAICLRKMPLGALEGAGRVRNPIVRAVATVAAELHGNQAHADDDWDTWRHSLGKHARKEFERCWRLFTRSPAARFERIEDPAAALRAFDRLETQQAERMRRGGRRYVLDQEVYRDVYRQALLGGLVDGSVVLTALVDGATIVAVQLGLVNERRWIALRLSTAGEAWARCSPGRLLLERTAAHLHAEGVRWFDFGVGDYAYKKVFGVTAIPLVDAFEALSWRGRSLVAFERLRRAIGRRPVLAGWLRRLRGREPVARTSGPMSDPRRDHRHSEPARSDR